MNLNRLRPTNADKKDLGSWLSGVVCDAIRDAEEAGLSRTEAYQILKTIAQMEHPMGYDAGRRDLP